MVSSARRKGVQAAEEGEQRCRGREEACGQQGGTGAQRGSGERCTSRCGDNTGEAVRELLCSFLQEMMKEDACCEPAVMDSEDMLFLLYTSGSTGKPKGLVHSQAGYLLFAALTHKVMDPSHKVLMSQQLIGSAGKRHAPCCIMSSSLSSAKPLGSPPSPSRPHLPTGSAP